MPASPSAAYRADCASRGEPFGPADDQWLAAASSLHLSVARPGQVDKEHLYDAIGIAVDVLGDEGIDRFVDREWGGNRTYVEGLVLLADEVHAAGALNLAALMFDDILRAAPDLTILHRGRILALRARVEWKLGRHDDAQERYDHVRTLAREAESAELEARAENGFIALAQLRGNLDDLREHAARAVQLAAVHRIRVLEHLAYQGLIVAQTKSGNLADAARSAWHLLEISRGDPVPEGEALQNLGQLLLDAGHPALARAAFAAVMRLHVSPRIVLPALGGLALASAQTGMEATVEWSMREVWRARSGRVPAYELAAALFECATALQLLRRDAEAVKYADAADELARRHRFHELQFRVESLRDAHRAPVRRPPGMPEPTFASAIAALEPEQLPGRLNFEAAPS